MVLPRCMLLTALLTFSLLLFGHRPFLNASDLKGVSRISADEVNALLGRPQTVIIDVRKARNWWRTSKKIPTAVREDPSRVDQWARKYAKNQTLIFY